MIKWNKKGVANESVTNVAVFSVSVGRDVTD
jgi:hypothetical protein